MPSNQRARTGRVSAGEFIPLEAAGGFWSVLQRARREAAGCAAVPPIAAQPTVDELGSNPLINVPSGVIRCAGTSAGAVEARAA